MRDIVDRQLARKFYSHFIESFERDCEANKVALISVWENKSRWTDFMLNPETGFLAQVVKAWALPLNAPSSIKSEWLKFDLMLVDTSGGKEWWQSVPVLTMEHENNNGIHDEVWKLACWKSRLKILITYHDNCLQADQKRAKAAQIIRNVQEGHDDAEWLVLSAPRNWGERLKWEGHEWVEREWSALQP